MSDSHEVDDLRDALNGAMAEVKELRASTVQLDLKIKQAAMNADGYFQRYKAEAVRAERLAEALQEQRRCTQMLLDEVGEGIRADHPMLEEALEGRRNRRTGCPLPIPSDGRKVKSP